MAPCQTRSPPDREEPEFALDDDPPPPLEEPPPSPPADPVEEDKETVAIYLPEDKEIFERADGQSGKVERKVKNEVTVPPLFIVKIFETAHASPPSIRTTIKGPD